MNTEQITENIFTYIETHYGEAIKRWPDESTQSAYF